MKPRRVWILLLSLIVSPVFAEFADREHPFPTQVATNLLDSSTVQQTADLLQGKWSVIAYADGRPAEHGGYAVWRANAYGGPQISDIAIALEISKADLHPKADLAWHPFGDPISVMVAGQFGDDKFKPQEVTTYRDRPMEFTIVSPYPPSPLTIQWSRKHSCRLVEDPYLARQLDLLCFVRQDFPDTEFYYLFTKK